LENFHTRVRKGFPFEDLIGCWYYGGEKRGKEKGKGGKGGYLVEYPGKPSLGRVKIVVSLI